MCHCACAYEIKALSTAAAIAQNEKQGVGWFYKPLTVFVSREISDSFFSRGKDLIAISLFEASALFLQCSVYMSWNGPRPFVYFAPLPSSCCLIRRGKSVVIPV